MTTQQDTGTNRRKGTGSIRERSAGHYELRYYDKATKSQAVRTYTSPRGEKGSGIRAARAELAKLIAEVESGQFVPKRGRDVDADARTVADLLDEWLKACESRDRSPTTVSGYRSEVRRIKAGPLKDKRLDKLTAHDLDSWYAELRSAGVSAATVLHYHRTLRGSAQPG